MVHELRSDISILCVATADIIGQSNMRACADPVVFTNVKRLRVSSLKVRSLDARALQGFVGPGWLGDRVLVKCQSPILLGALRFRESPKIP